jgi:hypothetical protein
MNEELFHIEKNFDLYGHLKANVKCTIGLCEIHDSVYSHYCFQCKRAICEVCKASFHSNHNLINKTLVSMNDASLNSIFYELEKIIKDTESFSKPEKIIREAKAKIENEFNELFNKLEELKSLRLLQVDNTYATDAESQHLLRNISNSKQEYREFFNKYKEFLTNSNVLDDDSFIFLQLYDLTTI